MVAAPGQLWNFEGVRQGWSSTWGVKEAAGAVDEAILSKTCFPKYDENRELKDRIRFADVITRDSKECRESRERIGGFEGERCLDVHEIFSLERGFSVCQIPFRDAAIFSAATGVHQER